MKLSPSTMLTPVYLKTDDEMPWPDEPVFYLLASNDLYICRNHRFFRSSVPAQRGPGELAEHVTSQRLHYPLIPRAMMESIVGFFDWAWKQHGAEAIVLIYWDEAARRVRAIVPQQVAAVTKNGFPIGVRYQHPNDVPADWILYADVHSHCDMGAYASQVDVEDEAGSAGLHIVIGQLPYEPPQFHVESVVDGHRFRVQPEVIVKEYRQRRTFPESWMEQLTVMDYASYCRFEFPVGQPGAPGLSANDSPPKAGELPNA